jgi:hypothetical protein
VVQHDGRGKPFQKAMRECLPACHFEINYIHGRAYL